MVRGDRVVWIKVTPPKQGRLTRVFVDRVDVEFFDGSARGDLPWAEVVADDGPIWPVTKSDARISPTGIDSEEGLGRF
jgi:hypothetical protein